MHRHGLRNEGAAWELDDVSNDGLERRWRRVSQGVGGHGRARCACGVYSDPLPSGAARKAWHRDHKNHLPTQEP